METIVKNVQDLDQMDRTALERVIGHELRETQQVIVNVVDRKPTTTNGSQSPPWANIYEGLSDEEVDRIDAVIRQRANLTRRMNTIAR